MLVISKINVNVGVNFLILGVTKRGLHIADFTIYFRRWTDRSYMMLFIELKIYDFIDIKDTFLHNTIKYVEQKLVP